MNRTSQSLLLAAALAAAAPLPSFADVLVGNLDQPTSAVSKIPADAGWAAQSFVTGNRSGRMPWHFGLPAVGSGTLGLAATRASPERFQP